MEGYSFNDEVGGTYSWGTISDIYEKIDQLCKEEAASPFVYRSHFVQYVEDPDFSNNYNMIREISISILTKDQTTPPDYSLDGAVLLYNFYMSFANFKVTE